MQETGILPSGTMEASDFRFVPPGSFQSLNSCYSLLATHVIMRSDVQVDTIVSRYVIGRHLTANMMELLLGLMIVTWGDSVSY